MNTVMDEVTNIGGSSSSKGEGVVSATCERTSNKSRTTVGLRMEWLRKVMSIGRL